MAGNPYMTSIILLISFGGIGYGLLRLTEPSEEKINKIRSAYAATHLTEDEKKKLMFMQQFRKAASKNN